MSTESAIPVEGKIVSILPGTMFRVELPNKQVVLAHISGKMRKRFIRLNLGDRVKLEMSPYDLSSVTPFVSGTSQNVNPIKTRLSAAYSQNVSV